MELIRSNGYERGPSPRKGRISRGLAIFYKSYALLLAHKKLIVFPLLSLFFSLLFIAGFLFSIISLFLCIKGNGQLLPFLDSLKCSAASMSGCYVVGLFIFCFGLFFTDAFFGAALIRCTYDSIKTGRATITDGLNAARARMLSILKWSAVVAIVAVVMSVLKKRKRMLAWLGGLTWDVVTLFALPVIVFEGGGPKKVIARSIEIVRQKWGETFTGQFSVGALLVALIFPLMVFSIMPLAQLHGYGEPFVVYIGIVLGVYLVFLLICFRTLSFIWKAALYLYAVENHTGEPFQKGEFHGLHVIDAHTGFRPYFINVLAVGVAISLLATWVDHASRRAENWPVTEGIVLNSGVKAERGRHGRRYAPKIIVSYEVQGMPYRGNRISVLPLKRFGNRSRAERYAAKYPAGKRVTVHYNPGKPDRYYVEPDSGALARWQRWGGLAFLVVGLWGAIFNGLNPWGRMRKHNA
ncbi:MAG: DUF6159 family protein [Candidatus Aureabacteria bacterium]|nr:DUF6159 family protein [Candidatus Auribacterota bacterium]